MHDLKDNDLTEICFLLKKRIIKLLYLKEDMDDSQIKEYDFLSYIDTLIMDFYGYYISTDNLSFYSSLCELEGIKQFYKKDIFRKKVLDLANFVQNIK